MPRETPRAEFGNDPATIEALKQATGYEMVRVQTGTRESDGAAVYEDGYLTAPGTPDAPGELSFRNESGQSCHVPAHRVARPAAAKPAAK